MSVHGNSLRDNIASVFDAYQARTITLVDALDLVELALVHSTSHRTVTARVLRVGGSLEEAPGPTVELEVSEDDARAVARHIYGTVTVVTPSERELADEAARRG
jgi:hypothetical protein